MAVKKEEEPAASVEIRYIILSPFLALRGPRIDFHPQQVGWYAFAIFHELKCPIFKDLRSRFLRSQTFSGVPFRTPRQPTHPPPPNPPRTFASAYIHNQAARSHPMPLCAEDSPRNPPRESRSTPGYGQPQPRICSCNLPGGNDPFLEPRRGDASRHCSYENNAD